MLLYHCISVHLVMFQQKNKNNFHISNSSSRRIYLSIKFIIYSFLSDIFHINFFIFSIKYLLTFIQPVQKSLNSPKLRKIYYIIRTLQQKTKLFSETRQTNPKGNLFMRLYCKAFPCGQTFEPFSVGHRTKPTRGVRSHPLFYMLGSP